MIRFVSANDKLTINGEIGSPFMTPCEKLVIYPCRNPQKMRAHEIQKRSPKGIDVCTVE